MSLSLLTGGMDQLYTVHDALGLHIRFGPSFKNNLLRHAPLAKTSCCDTRPFWWASGSVSIDPCRSYLGRLKNLRKQSRRNISTASTAILETRMQPGLRRNEQIFVQRTAQNRPLIAGKGPTNGLGKTTPLAQSRAIKEMSSSALSRNRCAVAEHSHSETYPWRCFPRP